MEAGRLALVEIKVSGRRDMNGEMPNTMEPPAISRPQETATASRPKSRSYAWIWLLLFGVLAVVGYRFLQESKANQY